MSRPVGPINHGSSHAYLRRKCRCDICRLAHNERIARGRRKRLHALIDGTAPHGVRASYDAGCRCNRCKQTRVDANKKDPDGGH